MSDNKKVLYFKVIQSPALHPFILSENLLKAVLNEHVDQAFEVEEININEISRKLNEKIDKLELQDLLRGVHSAMDDLSCAINDLKGR